MVSLIYSNGVGVKGQSEHSFGVLGQSTRRDGVRGECKFTTGSGVAGHSYWGRNRSLWTGKNCWSF